MNTNDDHSGSRYLLFLDILGFTQLVETKGIEEIYAIVDGALAAFRRWEDLNGDFKTIYFSDTFILYQDPKGFGNWAFLDIYAIGGMVLSALLAKGIPARGTISFGEFEVRLDTGERHQVYFGKALIEAYKAEQQEKWIGITILPSAWKPYESNNPGLIDVFTRERAWLKRDDDVLLLNPFIKLHAHSMYDLINEVTKPYSEWNDPEFPNDILALKFLREQAEFYTARSDFTGAVAIKYHTTIRFLKAILLPSEYSWAVQASLPENFYRGDSGEANANLTVKKS